MHDSTETERIPISCVQSENIRVTQKVCECKFRSSTKKNISPPDVAWNRLEVPGYIGSFQSRPVRSEQFPPDQSVTCEPPLLMFEKNLKYFE